MSFQKDDSRYHVGWITVSYRTVGFIVILVIAMIGGVFYFYTDASKTLASIGSAIGAKIGKITGTESSSATPKVVGQQQAKFTQIEGTVKVKKANSNGWAIAKYDTPLEKGDVVQTASEGMAKVIFADGTNYTIQSDSLIVVEENSTNAAQQTQVAVQVTTGTVDLATSTYTQGSKSQVIVAGATATLGPDTSALVLNDPHADEHEILVKKGAGEVTRGGEVVKLNNYERVTFTGDSPTMARSKELVPPTLITPANMMTSFTASKELRFSWTPIDGIGNYHLRISKNPYFSSLVMDKKVSSAEFRAEGIGEGAYYWSVQSIGSAGKESIESERNRFTVVPKAPEASMTLTLNAFVQHGHVIEVTGKTEVNARVMVNGEEVPIIGTDGIFHYFTPPLPNGESVITITAQNNRGGVNTQTKKVTIQ